MQSTQLITLCFIFGLGMPTMAFAAKESMHPTILFLTATILFLMGLTVYIVYKVRRSLRNQIDKSVD